MVIIRAGSASFFHFSNGLLRHLVGYLDAEWIKRGLSELLERATLLVDIKPGVLPCRFLALGHILWVAVQRVGKTPITLARRRRQFVGSSFETTSAAGTQTLAMPWCSRSTVLRDANATLLGADDRLRTHSASCSSDSSTRRRLFMLMACVPENSHGTKKKNANRTVCDSIHRLPQFSPQSVC